MKIDFTRTPDGSQRIVDTNLKVSQAFAIPLFTDSPDLNDNPDEPGYIRYHAGIIEVYNGTSWASQTLPAGGTNLQYLRGDKTWQTLDTLAVPENTNLYYTQGRFDAAFSAKSTTNLAEGTNKYYTDARVQSYSDARYLQLTGGVLSGDVQNATLPVNANSYITRGYLEGYLTGITWKQEVKAATTANITLSGTQTIDGVAMVANDRILVKNQTTQTANGIYIVQAGAWVRSTDADTSSEIGSATVLVRNGTTNKNTQWTCTNAVDPVLGSDAITFGQISGAGTYVNGTGIVLTGNSFSLDKTYTDGLYLTPTTADATYLKLSGGALTGALTSNSAITTTGTITGSLLLNSSVNANLQSPNGTSVISSASSQHQYLASTNNVYRVVFGGSLSSTLPSGSNYSQVLFSSPGTITGSAGTNPFVSTAAFRAPVLAAGAGSISVASTILIEAAPTVGASNYSLYSASGLINFVNTSENLRLTYDATNYVSFTVSSAGILTLAPTGGSISINGNIGANQGIMPIISTGDIRQSANSNNSRIQLATTGTTITRNIADASPAIVVNQANAASTGNIQNWQFNGTTVGLIGTNGRAYFEGVANSGSSNNALIQLGSAGLLASRNVADANASFSITQVNASSTGNILNLSNNTGIVASISQAGYLTAQAQAYSSGGASLLAKNTTTNRFEIVSELPAGIKASGATKTVSANTTLTAADFGANGHLTVYANATGGAFTITLPAAAVWGSANSTSNNFTVLVVKVDSSAFTPTVKANGAELINTTNTDITLSAQGNSAIYQSNGTQIYKF